MNKLVFIGILILIVTTNSFGQSPNSSRFKSQNSQAEKFSFKNDSLSKLTQHELELLLERSISYKKIGIGLTIAGPVSMASTFAYFGLGGESLDFGALLFFGGALITLIGIPYLIVNSLRVKKIENIIQDKVTIKIAPCWYHNGMAKSNQTGLTLRISF